MCDGRYFPIQRISGAKPRSSAIRSARPPDQDFSGSSHRSCGRPRRQPLRRACAPPSPIASGPSTDCTCNGKDAYGLVTLSIDERSDAARRRHRRDQRGLRGLQRHRPAEHRRVHADRVLSGLVGGVRQRLAETKIVPRERHAGRRPPPRPARRQPTARTAAPTRSSKAGGRWFAVTRPSIVPDSRPRPRRSTATTSAPATRCRTA